MKKNILKISEIISSNDNFVLITHVNPDGDAIGALLGLKYFLINNKKNVLCITPNKFPDFLAWMKGASDIIIFTEQKTEAVKIINNAQVIFMLDFSASRRLSEAESIVKNTPAIKILIDHHLQPEIFYDYVIHKINVSSTCELIYQFIKKIKQTDKICKYSAEALYVGIMTDTGSFSYSIYNNTFDIASALIKKGIDPVEINKKIYDNYSENRIRLIGYSLANKLEVMNDYHASFISLTQNELKKYNYQIGDTEGLVNYGLSIKGILLTALIIEKRDHIKISLRSKGDIDVNEIARKFFNGGGHKNAAGGEIKLSLDETINIFKNAVKQYAKKINEYAKIYNNN